MRTQVERARQCRKPAYLPFGHCRLPAVPLHIARGDNQDHDVLVGTIKCQTGSRCLVLRRPRSPLGSLIHPSLASQVIFARESPALKLGSDCSHSLLIIMLHGAACPIFQQSYPRYTCPRTICPPTGSISITGQEKLRELQSTHKWGRPPTQLVVGRAYLQVLLYIAHTFCGGGVTSPASRPAAQIPGRINCGIYKTD